MTRWMTRTQQAEACLHGQTALPGSGNAGEMDVDDELDVLYGAVTTQDERKRKGNGCGTRPAK
jgi:hypothetical protein